MNSREKFILANDLADQIRCVSLFMVRDALDSDKMAIEDAIQGMENLIGIVLDYI